MTRGSWIVGIILAAAIGLGTAVTPSAHAAQLCGDRVREARLAQPIYGERCTAQKTVTLTRLTADGQRFPLTYGGRYYYHYRVNGPNNEWWVDTVLFRRVGGKWKAVDSWSYDNDGDADWRYHNYVKPANLRPGIYGLASRAKVRYTSEFTWEAAITGQVL